MTKILFFSNSKSGLGTLEYVLLLLALVTALVIGQMPLRRALCGRWKSAADQIGFGRQYENEGTLRTTVVNS